MIATVMITPVAIQLQQLQQQQQQQQQELHRHSDLIVDFVPRRRPTTTSCSTDEKNANRNRDGGEQVCFAQTNTTTIIKYPSREERSRRWDSKKERYMFEYEMIRDVKDVQHLLSTTPMDAVEKEDLYKFIGLENLLSRRLAHYLRDKKREHVRSIVKIQHMLSDEQLAACAMQGSSESRVRAQKLAAGYWVILP
jgi:hypothetical protein